MPELKFYIKNNNFRVIAIGMLGLCMAIGFYMITYHTARHETAQLLTLFALLFFFYLLSYYFTKTKQETLFFLGFALLARFILLPSIPNLSDDFYRFLWDGMLINQGIHPFDKIPSELVKIQDLEKFHAISQILFQNMNSPDYFTVYPPVCQAVFAFASFLFPESLLGGVITIRVFILLSEIVTVIMIWKLLNQYQLPVKNILLYALNPLVVVELTGNLHFEAFMICFLLTSIFLLHQRKILWSGILFGFAVCSKLIPLIFLLLYIRRIGFKQLLVFFICTGITCLLLFLPFLTPKLVNGLSNSISLYFQKFEFNASFYYIIREIGYYRKGYNVIETAGKQLAAATFILIILFSILERNKRLLNTFLWVLLIYLLLATTVHPWYVIPLVTFGIFSNYRFPVVWSALIFCTYAGYKVHGYSENMAFVVIEYGVVLAIAVFEVWRFFYRKNFITKI